MPTLLAIKQGILRKLAWKDDKVGLLPIPLTTTSTASSTLGLRDTALARGTHGAGNYNGRHVEITTQPTKVDSTRTVNENPFAAGDTTLTCSASTGILVGDGIQLEDEICRVVTVTDGFTLELVRGIQGTTDAEHAIATPIYIIGPAVGEVAAVDDAGFDLTDALTTSPAFSATVRTGTGYLLYPKLLVPETLEDAVNGVLKKTEAPYLWAPSLVADSDMDADDLTKWPAVGTPTTRAFVTTAANILLGQRALHIVTVAAATDGARTSTFNTHENESLLVCLPVSVTTGDMRAVLYDASVGAVIKTVDELNDDAWTQVRFRETVPANCEQAYIQFLADTTAVSTFYISPHVIVQGSRRTAYDAPSWLVSESQVVEALYLPRGYSAEADDAFVALSSQMRAAAGLDFLRSDRDVTPMRVTFANQGNDPVYLLCKRPFAELSALTDTTPCDEEYVVAKAAAKILKNRGDDGWWVFDREAEKLARKMGYGGRQLRSESPTVLV